jgi:hypothetical protein
MTMTDDKPVVLSERAPHNCLAVTKIEGPGTKIDFIVLVGCEAVAIR